MHYTIYRVTNLLNNKTYIGKHQTQDLNDGYMGSGKLIKRAIAKYGIENFRKEIIHVFDNEADMNAKERELVVISEDTYNLCEGGKGGFGYIKANNLADYFKGRKAANEQLLKKYGVTNPGQLPQSRKAASRRMTDIHSNSCQKFRRTPPDWTGKTHKPESIRKMSEAKRGKNYGSDNSQFGTCWITDGTNNRKIIATDLYTWEMQGYTKGRKMK